MSACKQWSVGRTTDGGPVLEYGYLPLGVGFGMLNAFGPDEATAAYAALVQAVRDAERLRNLAARFEGHLNRGQTFTGAEIAAMLRGDGA